MPEREGLLWVVLAMIAGAAGALLLAWQWEVLP